MYIHFYLGRFLNYNPVTQLNLNYRIFFSLEVVFNGVYANMRMVHVLTSVVVCLLHLLDNLVVSVMLS